MNNNIEHEPQKLNTTYTVMLCLFFCYLFRLSIGAISQFSHWIVPEIKLSDNPTFFSIYYLVYFLWFAFGFWSIVLALKSSKYAIPCLKLCLPYHFLALLVSSLTKTRFICLNGSWLTLLIVLFPLIFYVYLCISKEIKETYPKKDRRWGVPGYIGFILYLLLILIFAQRIMTDVSKRRNSCKIDTAKIELFENEITDGRVVFKPKETWTMDSIVILNTVQDAFYFHDTLSTSIINIVCATEEYEPSRHYYIYSIWENQPDCIKQYYKYDIGFKEIDTEEYIIFVDQYYYQNDSTSYYWTYASKLGKTFEKGIRFSIVEKDSLRTSIDDAVEFLDSASIDIKDRLLKKN